MPPRQEAVGLNPDTAAYTKAKPRVRAYMIEHRAAVKERLVDQEPEGLRKLNLGRDQILARLWEGHSQPRSDQGHHRRPDQGSFYDHSDRRPDSGPPPFPIRDATRGPAHQPQIYKAEWLRKQQHQPAGEEPGDAVAPDETQPAAPPVTEPEPTPILDRNQPSVANPFINPEKLNRVPAATDYVFDAVLDKSISLKRSFSPDRRFSGRRR